MDGALSSDRHDNRRYDSSYGGRGRGDRRGGGRGGRHNRRHHPYRRDDYGGGRHNNRDNRRYDRDRGGYRGRGGGGGRGGRDRQPANRFSTETKSVDPQYAMMKQLTAMVAKMGDLGGAAGVPGSTSVG